MGRRGESITKISTGEVYSSIKEAAEKNGVASSFLANHLRGRAPSVKGETYQYTRLLNQ